eukprot:scaffold60022_cov35-Tisochrysis_lutea.AAC.5
MGETERCCRGSSWRSLPAGSTHALDELRIRLAIPQQKRGLVTWRAEDLATFADCPECFLHSTQVCTLRISSLSPAPLVGYEVYRAVAVIVPESKHEAFLDELVVWAELVELEEVLHPHHVHREGLASLGEPCHLQRLAHRARRRAVDVDGAVAVERRGRFGALDDDRGRREVHVRLELGRRVRR